MALGSEPTLLWELGRATRAGRAEPYVASVRPVHSALVRAARFVGPQRRLVMTLEPQSAAGGAVNVSLSIALLGGFRVHSVLVNGSDAKGWSADATEANGTVRLPRGPTVVEVRMA